jgi:glycosyltransferase involved in cell wall biosynthesis
VQLLHSPDFIPPHGGPWRSVITIHDLTFLRYPHFLTPESHRYYNRQIEAAVSRADAILTDSNSTRNDVLELLRVQPEKVTTVHLAVDERFRPQPEEVVTSTRIRLGLPQHYLLFVGTFEPRKNIPSLLHAYAELRSRHSDTPPLLLVGNPGWLFESTDALLDELGLRGAVTYRSNFPSEDLPALYSGAVALILPSHYEGFGFPVLEAMACGTATIIADRASLPEIAGDAALMCDPGLPESITEAMSRVLFDSELRIALEQKGLQRAGEFSWETCCAQTLEVYRHVLGQSQTP